MKPRCVAVSTGYAVPAELRQLCETSVWLQSVPCGHIYIDAYEQGGACLENVYHAVHNLPPDTIVLWVDGDDYLYHDHVVERVLLEYEAGAWMTWGQYLKTNGGERAKGHCFDSRNRRACRREKWYASHLRTFRAGLFQQIKREDLMWKGTWSPECCDLTTMFPMLEMADDRAAFIPDILYVYRYDDRQTRRHDDDASPLGKAQATYQAELRRRPPYARLVKQPW